MYILYFPRYNNKGIKSPQKWFSANHENWFCGEILLTHIEGSHFKPQSGHFNVGDINDINGRIAKMKIVTLSLSVKRFIETTLANRRQTENTTGVLKILNSVVWCHNGMCFLANHLLKLVLGWHLSYFCLIWNDCD